jgi:hypothetical protein
MTAKLNKHHCGKCGKNPTSILEEKKLATHWDIDVNGHLTNPVDTSTVTTGKITAQCECGNIWRLRRVRSVEHLKQYPNILKDRPFNIRYI